MPTPYGPVEYEHDGPVCPECGDDDVDWIECSDCKGEGLITCICEGAGGDYKCGVCGEGRWGEENETKT